MRRRRVAPAVLMAALLAAAACYVVPRGVDANTQLAIEDAPSKIAGLKIAETPREMARVAKLAEKEGSKTRAILKTVGRGAIALTLATFDLGMWILGALFTAFAFVFSLKSATERGTQRFINYRKRRRLERFAALTARV